jgi:plastocyanin
MGLVTGVAVALLAVPWAGSVAAGGGCHRGPTQGEGTSIEMAKLCFTPSILQVDPGAEVTFTNLDPMGHNVTASGWGQFDAMLKGEAFSATFAEPGVYPFACSYHPGMTGAVVVGSGTGPGSGEAVTVGSVIDDEAPQARPAAATDQGQSPVGWLAGGALGLVLGAGLGLFIRRRSSPVQS